MSSSPETSGSGGVGGDIDTSNKKQKTTTGGEAVAAAAATDHGETTTMSAATAASGPSKKIVWKVFWDLQCPYSKKNWLQMPRIRERFTGTHVFEIHLTSLAFHPQAFKAQCCANLVFQKKGPDAKLQFVDECFKRQDEYMNAAVGNARPSEIDRVFASIAKTAGVLDGGGDDDDDSATDGTKFTEIYFVELLGNWELAVKPAYEEHKRAMRLGVYGTPSHVVDDALLNDTESAWGPDEWTAKLTESS